jgi:predicted ATPase/DNA-binding CsgD family transcriptional regulator
LRIANLPMSKTLPFQLTRFIGRQQEMVEVRRALSGARLVTLTGPGGSGKSRLAMEVARPPAGDGRDGPAWVDLAPVADESLVVRTVAAAVGVPEQGGQPAGDGLTAFLGDRELLLVLDNCEHLAGTCAGLAERLLRECPALRLLVTSRQPLAVAGETVYPVPALRCPPAGLPDEVDAAGRVGQARLDELAAFEAVSLFLDRAAAAKHGFVLTPENAGSIATICRELDGMPLAIELAAAWVSVLSAGQIAARLNDRLGLLAFGGRAGIAERHQTLRATLDWSHDLLTPPEQALLRRLSVFAGGCSLAAAEAVCSGQGVDGEMLLPLLGSLVDKSFVTAETIHHSEARYRLLETIRQYAAEKLEAAGEWALLRDRHFEFYLELVQDVEPKLTGAYQELWLNWLAGEYDNLRAALSRALETGQIAAGLRMAVCLYQFWTIRDHVEEGLDWSGRLLARAGEGVPPAVRASALVYASIMAGRRGQSGLQSRYAGEAAALAETAAAAGPEGRRALALARGAQGWVAQKAGDYRKALELAGQEAELFRELGDGHNLGLALSIFSFSAMSLGELAQAQAMLDEARPLLRQSGDPYRLAMALNYSGDLARCQGEYGRAEAAYLESIELLREVDARRDLASALHNLGHACWHQGRRARARALFEESLAIHQEQQNRLGLAECLIGFAALAVGAGLPAEAVRLLGAAGAAGGRHITDEWAATRREFEQQLERARAGLTEAGFQREWAAGQWASLDQAVALAEEVAGRAAAAEAAQAEVGGLTAREAEVAGLIGRGLANGEIAERLVISKRTVESHVANIRGKLGFTTRAQMVRWAIETGLVPPAE